MAESTATGASRLGSAGSRQQGMLVLFLFCPVPKLMGWCQQYLAVHSISASMGEAEMRVILDTDTRLSD